jgi:hypothetical protein
MVHRLFYRKKSCAIDDYLAVDAISGSPELSKYQHDLERIVAKASTFTFKDGVGQLIDALVTSLRGSGKVKIIMNSDVKQVASDPTFGIEVCLSKPCAIPDPLLTFHRSGLQQPTEKDSKNNSLTMSYLQFPQWHLPTC